MVQNIVEPRQSPPILANVLLEAEGESVRMTATDVLPEISRLIHVRIGGDWLQLVHDHPPSAALLPAGYASGPGVRTYRLRIASAVQYESAWIVSVGL